MTKKTKYEKKETAVSKATFTLDEVHDFALIGYSKFRKDLYLEKVAQRPPNPRMIAGLEVLSPITMVAEADMMPLSTRQNLARFVTPASDDLYGRGYDADDTDMSDESFELAEDRVENPATKHELRVKRLERKLERAREAYIRDMEKRAEGGDTPLPEGDPNPAKTLPPPEGIGPVTKPKPSVDKS